MSSTGVGRKSTSPKSGPGQPGQGPPAGRQQPAGGEQQGGKHQRQGQGRIPRPGGIPGGKGRGWQRAGSGQQRVGGIFACQPPGEGQQRDGREDPADRVPRSMGHHQGPDHHEGTKAQHKHHEVGWVLLEAAVSNGEDGRKDHADDEDCQHRPGHPAPAVAHGLPRLLQSAATAPRLVSVLHQHRPESVTKRVIQPKHGLSAKAPQVPNHLSEELRSESGSSVASRAADQNATPRSRSSTSMTNWRTRLRWCVMRART